MHLYYTSSRIYKYNIKITLTYYKPVHKITIIHAIEFPSKFFHKDFLMQELLLL